MNSVKNESVNLSVCFLVDLARKSDKNLQKLTLNSEWILDSSHVIHIYKSFEVLNFNTSDSFLSNTVSVLDDFLVCQFEFGSYKPVDSPWGMPELNRISRSPGRNNESPGSRVISDIDLKSCSIYFKIYKIPVPKIQASYHLNVIFRALDDAER